jgi:uncharacterized protein YjiS (DUF1127 family)
MHTIKQALPTVATFPVRLGPRLEAAAWRLLRPMIAAQRRWRDGQMLAAMDARMLRDIGVTRADARREADKLMGPLGRW